ncbi:glycoside hydrolase family 25 protein [Bengtsoniella intestinalis]|uniref:glycoside hydrolase family 25 protein n=1 Tax=Bengtsoniella intestinalis TaxID=3073143 RepID=UPI00391F3C86
MPDMMDRTTSTTVAEPRPPAHSRQRVRPQRNHTGLMVLTMLLSFIAAITSSGICYFYWLSLQPVEEAPIVAPIPEEEVIDPVEYISFGNYQLPINPDLAVNTYDQDGFIVGDDGIISYGDARLGIDVSSHQGDIDWQAVADDGVSFAIIRLGFRGYGEEGVMILDSHFHQNMVDAQAAGIDVGVYFFSQATSVWETLEEAYFVLEHLDGYELQLPVVFDWEFIDNSSIARTNGTTGQCITLYNQVFNEQMQKAGYDTMIYFNQSLAYLYMELDLLADNPFWLASYRNNPTYYYDFQIWQYSDKGAIDGIEGYVDLNLMLVDLTAEEEPLQAATE